MAQQKKVAIVYDWLTNMGGAERVVLAAHKAFPNAPIYTSVFDSSGCPQFANMDIRTTWLQNLPAFLRKRHQLLPLFRFQAFRALNLQQYDTVLSITSAEAKAVRVRPNARHICYCLTPTRYYWSHYKDYKKEPGFGLLNPIVRLVLPLLVGCMRAQDTQATKGVTNFVGISTAVADRILQYYKRPARIIYPPVDMSRFRNLTITGTRKGYIALGRQVPYKRFDLAIQACNKLNLPLTVYGNGPEHQRLVRLAGPTIHFVTNASDAQIATALTKAKALLFPQEEDFGIVQIEAMAAGCPVIGYNKGGAQDIIKNNTTGIFFAKQTPESLSNAIKKAQKINFQPHILQAHAETFSEEHFIAELKQLING